MRLQVTAPLGGKSSDCTFRREIQNSNQEGSSRLDWIQVTGLIVQNQAETPNLENLGDWIGSSQLD
jgi:hypothetical protein